jgi:hypothetical protein
VGIIFWHRTLFYLDDAWSHKFSRITHMDDKNKYTAPGGDEDMKWRGGACWEPYHKCKEWWWHQPHDCTASRHQNGRLINWSELAVLPCRLRSPYDRRLSYRTEESGVQKFFFNDCFVLSTLQITLSLYLMNCYCTSVVISLTKYSHLVPGIFNPI